MKRKARRFLSGCLAALLLVSAIPVEAASGNTQEARQEEESINSKILTEPEQASEEIQGTEQIPEEAQEPEETPEEAGNAGAVLPGVDVDVQPELEEDPARLNEQMEIVEELLGDNAEQALAGEGEDDGLPMVRLGDDYFAVVKTDGSLWVWGDNGYGQLGDGTTTDRHEPVKVMEGVRSVTVAVSECSAAIRTDGSLWMWGDNWYGQLGDGTTTDRHEPVKIMDLVTPTGDDPAPPTPAADTYTLTLDPSASARVTDRTFTISGKIGLEGGGKKTLTQWREILGRIGWSADEDVSVDVACREDFRAGAGIGGGEESVDLIVTATPANVGTTELTGTFEGASATCAVTIERDQADDTLQEALADFDEVLYRARSVYDRNSGSVLNTLNAQVAGRTPSMVMYSAARENNLTFFAESWNGLQAVLGAIDDPSTLLDKPLKKTELYEGIIFALFEVASEKTTTMEYDIIKDMNSLFGIMKTDMKTLYDINIYENYDMSKLTDGQRERIWTVTEDYFRSYGFSGDICKYLTQIKDLVEIGSSGMKAIDFIKYMLSCVAVLQMSEGYKAVLRDMCGLCPSDNLELKTALLDCVSMMEAGTVGFISITIMIAKGIAVAGKDGEDGRTGRCPHSDGRGF